MSKIYLASSWRNEYQPILINLLRGDGHTVYDFRNPFNGGKPFQWFEIDGNWKNWTAEQYVASLSHPRAIDGFSSDFNSMNWCDTCVLLLPAGSSAHLELGWCVGAGKRGLVLAHEIREPELMIKIADEIFTSTDILRQALK